MAFMQISSTNSGSSSSGLYPAVLPAVRKQAVGASPGVDADVTAASNARSLQQVVPAVAPTNVSNNADAYGALILARQRGGYDTSVASVQAGRLDNGAAAQRAVQEYTNVAVQEQRFELSGVLAGIDLFA